MEDILEMEEEYVNIYVLYEINDNAENVIWYYDDMPDYMGWIGRGSTVPFEKDESGNLVMRETLYPREEQFYCDTNFKEDSIKYLKLKIISYFKPHPFRIYFLNRIQFFI